MGLSFGCTVKRVPGIISHTSTWNTPGDEVAIALDGEVIEGAIPHGKMQLVLAWMEIHREDLYANWQLLYDGEQFFRIEPLK
jgi:hypothetical protein